jgi:hypothetical protein
MIADVKTQRPPTALRPDQDPERRIIAVLERSSEMSILALLQSLKESILLQANVKAIYGQPIVAHSKTVIPVAKITYRYGAGAGI